MTEFHALRHQIPITVTINVKVWNIWTRFYMNVWKARVTICVIGRDFEETVFFAEYMRFFLWRNNQNQS